MDFRKRWNQFANYNKISEATFFDYCTRPWLVEMVKQKTIYYPAYGK